MTASVGTPEPWRTRTIGELGSVVTGSTPGTNQPAFWGGLYPFVTPGDLGARRSIDSAMRTLSQLGAEKARLLPPGTVMVTCIGATIGKSGIVAKQCATNQQINSVICDDNRIVADYLYYALKMGQADLVSLAGTTAVPIVSKSKFESIEIAVPPLPEQRKIAAILTSVDEAIEATQAVIDQLQIVKKAMMSELLTRGIPGRHTKFKMTEIGEVPEEWEVVELKSLLVDGPTNGLYKPQDKYGSGSPILRIDTFSNGDLLVCPHLRRVAVEADELARFSVRKSDIVVNRVNSLSHLGKTAFISEIVEPTVFESNMMRLRTNAATVDAIFAFYVLSSDRARTHFLDRAKQAVAQASINQQDVNSLPIQLPPMAEQIEISSVISSIRQRLDAEREHAALMMILKSALMSVLLTGEVRVKVDGEGA